MIFFTPGDWLSYPIPFDPVDFPFWDLLDWQPSIPSDITDYLGTTKYADIPLTVEFPALILSGGGYYGTISMTIRVSSTGVVLLGCSDRVNRVPGRYFGYAPMPVRARPVSGTLKPVR